MGNKNDLMGTKRLKGSQISSAYPAHKGYSMKLKNIIMNRDSRLPLTNTHTHTHTVILTEK